MEKISFTHAPIRRASTGFTDEESLKRFSSDGTTSIRDFVVDDSNATAYANLLRWANGDKRSLCVSPETGFIISASLTKGWYIAGGTGTGKSWALRLLRMFCTNLGLKVKIRGQIRPLTWLTVSASQICEVFRETGNLSVFYSEPMLAIDDLGAEQQESMCMGSRLQVLKDVLERRGDNEYLMTFVTSNLPLNSDVLRERYGDRVASRLCGMCNYLILPGKDRRMQ